VFSSQPRLTEIDHVHLYSGFMAKVGIAYPYDLSELLQKKTFPPSSLKGCEADMQ
jgi:hypothetical protein